MTTTTMSYVIDAPVEEVFDVVAHIENFSKAVPAIADVEFISEQRSGVGTRFRETRVMGRREATSELEVTEYEEGSLIRLVAEEGGSTWDSRFTTTAEGESTRLDFTMVATPHTFAARILDPLTKGIVAKAIRGDMEAVKAYCEV
ncbi:MAG: SRPBCC family protein [Actinomycetota bacterium]